MEDMLWDGKSGLTEAVVIGPDQAFLLYGRQSLEEGLSLGEVQDTTFMLSGAISWVGKQAQFNTNALTLQEGWQLITQAITEWCVEARGPGHHHTCPPVLPPFSFCSQDRPLSEQRLPGTNEWVEEPRHTGQTSCHDQGMESQCGWDHRQRWWDPWASPSPSPSPSPDCRFESDRSSVSASSSVSSRSNRSGGTGHMHHGWHQRARSPYENQFASLQGWGHEGNHHLSKLALGFNGVSLCWVPGSHPLPYAMHCLQGYPGELVRSLGTDIPLDCILAILDEHYNNVKALDALNQELLQLWMGEKETVSDCGVCLSRHLQILMSSFPECFPLDHVAELKQDCLYGGLPKQLKVMVAYLKASSNERMYSDYLWVAHEAEKEEAKEPSHNQTAAITNKPKVMSFFPLWKLKGSQPTKTPSVQVAHL